jgi:hypothetical protein
MLARQGLAGWHAGAASICADRTTPGWQPLSALVHRCRRVRMLDDLDPVALVTAGPLLNLASSRKCGEVFLSPDRARPAGPPDKANPRVVPRGRPLGAVTWYRALGKAERQKIAVGPEHGLLRAIIEGSAQGDP